MAEALINLSKGERINLSKQKALKNLKLKLNWAPQKREGTEFDLDASIFICKYDAEGDPKLINNASFIFYNNKVSPDGAIVHSGDDLTGAEGEEININLEALSPEIDEISFVVTIFEGNERKQNFGQVPKSSIRLFNSDTGEEFPGYHLDDDFSSETAVQFGSLYKKNNEWLFKAIGTGYKMGLDEFVRGYGGTVA